jgi:hypothetical protein
LPLCIAALKCPANGYGTQLLYTFYCQIVNKNLHLFADSRADGTPALLILTQYSLAIRAFLETIGEMESLGPNLFSDVIKFRAGLYARTAARANERHKALTVLPEKREYGFEQQSY